MSRQDGKLGPPRMIYHIVLVIQGRVPLFRNRHNNFHRSPPLKSTHRQTSWCEGDSALKNLKTWSDGNALWSCGPANASLKPVSVVSRRCAAGRWTDMRAIPRAPTTLCSHLGRTLKCRWRGNSTRLHSRQAGRTVLQVCYHPAPLPPQVLLCSGRSKVYIFQIASVLHVLLHGTRKSRLLRVHARKNGRSPKAGGCGG
jgi:hypothetical protein